MTDSTDRLESEKTKKSRILVIDDNTELLTTLSKMLDHLGHECIGCSEPIKALDVINREHQDIDLLMTDYSMPGLSGLEIIDYCAEHFPRLPVVLITGFARKISNISKTGKPVEHILHKPISLSNLGGMLSKILDEHWTES